MAATILVVDDEPDLEALVLQKFRKRIRNGAVTFMFAHDGIEALQSIAENPQVDLVVSDINMPRRMVCRCCRSCRKPKAKNRRSWFPLMATCEIYASP